MSTQSFKDLIVWQKARDLSVAVYRTFGDSRDYGFRDQIQRASVSIMNNIAEGYARRSDKAFRHFLLIAKGSVAEVESMLVLANELVYIDKTAQTELVSKTEEIGRLLSAFIKKL
ncbi:MAG TPA: four helix bundle protein [Candidatus Saccharimonadales bacterium]|nr:four helix bundle protein [Candidatus Saccharimonadales bacterium]